MPNEVTGRFYFKRTTNGNLIGEFSNDGGVVTESSDLVNGEIDFHGKSDLPVTFNSTWQENGKPYFATLVVTRKGKLLDLFDLVWTGKYGAGNFKGKGMLCDDILIGDYQSTKS
ncbi:MAG TPA: hypothetical protein VFC44_18590 [Candidatus Saccharimonadales bacterium]|nr:hypothetical protein [Candidatus Saccharimonadales bacterium]